MEKPMAIVKTSSFKRELLEKMVKEAKENREKREAAKKGA